MDGINGKEQRERMQDLEGLEIEGGSILGQEAAFSVDEEFGWPLDRSFQEVSVDSQERQQKIDNCQNLDQVLDIESSSMLMESNDFEVFDKAQGSQGLNLLNFNFEEHFKRCDRIDRENIVWDEKTHDIYMPDFTPEGIPACQEASAPVEAVGRARPLSKEKDKCSFGHKYSFQNDEKRNLPISLNYFQSESNVANTKTSASKREKVKLIGKPKNSKTKKSRLKKESKGKDRTKEKEANHSRPKHKDVEVQAEKSPLQAQSKHPQIQALFQASSQPRNPQLCPDLLTAQSTSKDGNNSLDTQGGSPPALASSLKQSPVALKTRAVDHSSLLFHCGGSGVLKFNTYCVGGKEIDREKEFPKTAKKEKAPKREFGVGQSQPGLGSHLIQNSNLKAKKQTGGLGFGGFDELHLMKLKAGDNFFKPLSNQKELKQSKKKNSFLYPQTRSNSRELVRGIEPISSKELKNFRSHTKEKQQDGVGKIPKKKMRIRDRQEANPIKETKENKDATCSVFLKKKKKQNENNDLSRDYLINKLLVKNLKQKKNDKNSAQSKQTLTLEHSNTLDGYHSKLFETLSRKSPKFDTNFSTKSKIIELISDSSQKKKGSKKDQTHHQGKNRPKTSKSVTKKKVAKGSGHLDMLAEAIAMRSSLENSSKTGLKLNQIRSLKREEGLTSSNTGADPLMLSGQKSNSGETRVKELLKLKPQITHSQAPTTSVGISSEPSYFSSHRSKPPSKKISSTYGPPQIDPSCPVSLPPGPSIASPAKHRALQRQPK